MQGIRTFTLGIVKAWGLIALAVGFGLAARGGLEVSRRLIEVIE